MNEHYAALIFSSFAAVFTGSWAFMGSIRKQFDISRKESEDRASRTHARIDDLRQHMDQNFVSIASYASEQRRLDEALHERDRQLSDISSRIGCPGAQGYRP